MQPEADKDAIIIYVMSALMIMKYTLLAENGKGYISLNFILKYRCLSDNSNKSQVK